MKELKFYPTSKNLFKVNKITLEQSLFTFTPNAIFVTTSIGLWRWLVGMPEVKITTGWWKFPVRFLLRRIVETFLNLPKLLVVETKYF